MGHRWRGYDHPELYRMINSGPGPSASTPQTEYWDALMRELGEIDGDLNAKLRSLDASWEGQAGEQAQGALNPLQAWAGDAQTGASGMRASTEYQADMIARARSEMPEPVPVTTPAPSGWSKVAAGAALLTGNPGPAMAVANQAADHEQQEAAQDAAAQKAVDTMDSYSSSSEFNRNTLGEFVPPPDVVVSTPAPTGGSGSPVSHFSSATSGYTTGGSGSTAPSYAGAPAPVGGGGFTPVTGGGSPAPVGGVTGGTPAPGYTPVGTTPAGYQNPTTAPTGPPVAPAAGPPAPVTGGPTAVPGLGGGPVGGGPGFGGGAGAGGGSGPRGGFGGGRTGLPFAPGALEAESTRGNQSLRPGFGLGMAGEAGAGGRPGGVVGVPASGAARGGGAGLGMPVGGGAAGSEDDHEHGLADYLIETVDVFGDERTVSQPVIGEDLDR